jgi:hypothetical protein
MNLGPIISVPPVVSKLSRGASCPAKRAPRSVTNANLAWVQSSTDRVPVFGSAHAKAVAAFYHVEEGDTRGETATYRILVSG